MAGFITETSGDRTWISSITLQAGESKTLYYYHSDVNLYEKVNGSSSNSSIASFTAGSYQGNSFIPFTVRGVSGGSTTIEVYTGSNNADHKATLSVTVESVDFSISRTPSGTVTLKVGDTQDFVFTASPSNLSYSWSLSYSDYYNCISTQLISSSGNTATYRVTALAVGDGSDQFAAACTAGGTTHTVPVLVNITEKEDTVTSISISGPDEVASEGTATFTAVTSPSSAANRHVTWSKQSGGSYFSIQSQTDTTTGGRCTIKAVRTTSTQRCMIKCESEDGAAVAYYTFDILAEEDPTIYVEDISLSVSNSNPFEGEAVTVYATTSPSNADDDWVYFSVDSGSAYLPSVMGSKSTQVTSDVAGRSVIRATARDGGGATATIAITWRQRVSTTAISLSGVSSMSGYDGAVTLEEGETLDFTATLSPSDTDDALFGSRSSTAFNVSVRQIGSQVGTNVYTVRVSGLSEGTGVITLWSGSVYSYVYVTVEKKPTYVEDITFNTFDSELKPGMVSGVIRASSVPALADNGMLNATIISGSQYIHLDYDSPREDGIWFQVTADAIGTAVVRVQAVDDGGYYEDITFTVVDKFLSTGISLTPNNRTVYVGFETTIEVMGLRDETYTVEVVSGAGTVEVSTNGKYITVKGLVVGTAVIEATTSDTGLKARGTYPVSDEYPADMTYTLSFTVGVGDSKLVWNSGWIIHGGSYAVQLQEGLTWAGETTIPAYADSTLVQPSSGGIGPTGVPTEAGTRTVYMTNPETTETYRYIIKVDYAGEFTKKIVFDANLPPGTFLSSPVPEDMVAEMTGESYSFQIPAQEPAAPGFIFCYWDAGTDQPTDKDFVYSDVALEVTGDDVEVILKAVWFPVPEGFTATSTRSYFSVSVSGTVPVGGSLNISLPNTGQVDPARYPLAHRLESGSLTGVTYRVNGATLQGIDGASLSSGAVVLTGEAETEGQVIEFSALDQRNVRVYYTLETVGAEIPEGQEGSYVLDANGGTFPTGQSRVTMRAPDGVYALPDWSVVDRPGYRLTGWTGNVSGSADMGSEQRTSETWTAQWAVDSRGYSGEYLPHASVRIHRDIDQFIDCTMMTPEGGEPVVEVAENSAGQAAFSLVLSETPSSSVLSPSCSLWSSGPVGAIRTGMYVRIDDIGSDGRPTYLMDGFITTITPSDDSVSITVGDWLSFLSKMGSTYRRNFYGTSRTSGTFDGGSDSTGLYADVSGLSSESSIDGNPSWKVLADTVTSGSIELVLANTADGGFRSTAIDIPVDADTLDSVVLRIGYDAANLPSTHTLGMSWTVSSGGETVTRTMTKTFTKTGGIQWEDLTLSGLGLSVSGGTVRIVAAITSHTGSGTAYLYTYRGTGGNLTITVGNASPLENATLEMTVTAGTWELVTGWSGPSGGKLYITEIADGAVDVSDPSLYTPSEDRCLLPYVSGSQTVGSIMESVSFAVGLTPMSLPVIGGEANLQMFRTGGGFALDYLRKLADVQSSAGRRRAFAVRGYTTPVIVLSSRHLAQDAPLAHIHYGGDEPSESIESIAYSSFSPSLTFKSRPNLVMVRGTMSAKGSTESVPIMVAVEDHVSTSRRFGMVVESVIADSSVNRLVDAASSAWATLCQNSLDEWEGTVTVPGIRRDILPASGLYAGSGEVLRLTDSQYGISSAVVRARQLRMDYNACTTTVTLTNRSMVYSSDIPDTVAMARTSADVATGDNSTTLFNTQYVRIRTEEAQTVKDSGNEVKGYLLNSNNEFMFEDISVLILPNGRSVLVASAPPDGENHADDDKPYDVMGISVNGGAMLPIKPSLRPDYYTGQTLLLNLDFPTQ